MPDPISRVQQVEEKTRKLAGNSQSGGQVLGWDVAKPTAV